MSYVLEESGEGVDVVVTGRWSTDAEEALLRGDADGLVLNYARGFSGGDLDFLDGSWRVLRLHLLARSITDLAPIGRLAGCLEHLSVQAAPPAQIDLAVLGRLRSVAGEWALLRDTLAAIADLESVITWRFDESDLHAFRDHFGLRRLTIKEAPNLESLSGASMLSDLQQLDVLLARSLGDITGLAGLRALQRLELQNCRSVTSLDVLESLENLLFLSVSECGSIESLTPLEASLNLEQLYAWGSTRIADADLSPLARLPRLREVRMRDRREYTPRLAEVLALLSSR